MAMSGIWLMTLAYPIGCLRPSQGYPQHGDSHVRPKNGTVFLEPCKSDKNGGSGNKENNCHRH